MATWLVVSVLACCAWTVMAASKAEVRRDSITTPHMDILMKGAHPSQPDAYLCTSYEVIEEEAYVVKFEALANASTAHHILMYGCPDESFSTDSVWQCPPMCRDGEQQIMFAWAKNAPPTQLPKGVGFRIGKRTSIRTIVMQIHYAKPFGANEAADKSGIRLHISHERQPNVAGIFLMMSYGFAVPPNRPKYHVDMSCQYNDWHTIYPFAYRTHAHGLGSVITGYQYNDTGYHMIGKGNPQWPQAFYPSNASIAVKPGDKLVARCTYNSTGMDHLVHVGATGNDEMCNFYIMFYTDSSVRNPYGECGGVQIPELVDHMPADSDVTLPPNPLLDEMAHGHHHHHHSMPSSSPTSPDQQPEPTGHATAKGGHPDVSREKQSWFDLPGTEHHRLNEPLMQYLAQNILSNRQPAEDKWSDPAHQLSMSEERIPDQFEEWLQGLGDIDVQKRMGGEFYEDYAANDEREQGTFPEANPGLSRNRNKAFEAMNQELKGFQHIKPHGDAAGSDLWSQYPQTSSRKKLGSMPLVPDRPPIGNLPPVEPLKGRLVLDKNLVGKGVSIGQVGGLSTDLEGNVYVFHRGSRVWGPHSFDYDHNFQFKDQPIMEDTVLIFSPDGKLIRQFGGGKFYMPHGIEVDSKGNIWLTDVALHQVFRVPAGGTEPDLTLGEAFVHNEDAAHFCKPSDVAVLESGDFFVADGYCNSRILKFSKEGRVLRQWGQPNRYDTRVEPQPGWFSIPHSVTVAEDLNLVCVADRENGRIQCFDMEGTFKFIITHPEFGPRLFAVDYCPLHGGLLFAVNGPSFDGTPVTVKGFTISLRNSSVLETWNRPTSQGLQNPHDVTVDAERHAVYVGELDPHAVWRFHRQVPTVSTTTTTSTAAPQPTSTQISATDKPKEVAANTESNSVTIKDDSRKAAITAGQGKEGEVEEEESDFTPSIIIGVLLVIPVVLLLVITLVMRMHHRGWDSCLSRLRAPKVFSFQNILGNSHRGFDKLSQEDSDHDADVLSDSDNEEFRQPIKSKA